jgi:hypothetical protein
MEQMTRGSRPLGITIIAIIMAIQGILGIIGGIILLAHGVGAPGAMGLGIFTLILGILYLVLAWGLWTLQPWAFWTTVVIEVIALINGILGLVGGQTGVGILSLILPIIILIYLFADRNVRAAFRT